MNAFTPYRLRTSAVLLAQALASGACVWIPALPVQAQSKLAQDAVGARTQSGSVQSIPANAPAELVPLEIVPEPLPTAARKVPSAPA
jgi:hypothetical protein